MATTDPSEKVNKLKLHVSAGPRFGSKGETLAVECVVSRQAVGSPRGWGLSLGDAIDELFALERQPAEEPADDDLM